MKNPDYIKKFCELVIKIRKKQLEVIDNLKQQKKQLEKEIRGLTK